MAGLVPAIHVLAAAGKTWMRGTSPRMTKERVKYARASRPENLAMPYDLILRGGRVIDPSQKLDAVTDVAFANGKVARIGAGLQADSTTDVRDVNGAIVTPGLIDLHTHVYWGGTSLGVDAEDLCRRSGVTTAVDTGS